MAVVPKRNGKEQVPTKLWFVSSAHMDSQVIQDHHGVGLESKIQALRQNVQGMWVIVM